MALALVSAVLAFPESVTVVPLIAVTVCPSSVEPTTKVGGAAAIKVTVGEEVKLEATPTVLPYGTAVVLVISWLAVPLKTTLLPLMAVMVWPSNCVPTTKEEEGEETVTPAKLLALPVPVGLVPAVVTVPPEKAIVGALLKLLPALVMVIPITVPEVPPLRTAVAVAPVPPPAVMATVGAAE